MILPKVVICSVLLSGWMKNDAFSDDGRFRARTDPGLAADASRPRTRGSARPRRVAQGPAGAGDGKRRPVPENSRRLPHADLPGRAVALVRRNRRRSLCGHFRRRGLRQPAEPARQAVPLHAEPAFAAGLLPGRVAPPAGRRARRDAALGARRPVRHRPRDRNCLAGARHARALRAQDQAFPGVRGMQYRPRA